MSMIHSSIMSLGPLLTDVLLWTTERLCYVCYTIKNDGNINYKTAEKARFTTKYRTTEKGLFHINYKIAEEGSIYN